MDDDEELRGNVRAELARAGISVAAMNRRLGWNKAYLSRRLAGPTSAAFLASDLRAIAAELQIDVARFYETRHLADTG